jgi:putative salt-induced outer membrane protein
MITDQRVRSLLVAAVSLYGSAAAAQTPPAVKEPPPLWDVQVGASFVGTSGNSDTTSIGADFAAHRRGRVWQLESSAVAVRLDDRDIVTAERYLGMFRGRRKLTPVVGLTAGIRLERDRFSGIDFRSISDAGLGWALVRRPEWTVDATTALAWKHDEPIVGSDRDDPVGVLQVLSRVPLGASGDTTQRFTYYPDFNRSSSYRSEVELALQAAMNSRLALKIGYLLRYSNEPVPGFKKTDSTTTASVVLRWKATTTAPAS